MGLEPPWKNECNKANFFMLVLLWSISKEYVFIFLQIDLLQFQWKYGMETKKMLKNQ